MLRLTLILAVASLAPAEIIDQIAVRVDDRVITRSQVNDEIRVTAFLNGEKPDLSPENRRRAAERLVDQSIMRREMELARYAQPEQAEIDSMKKQLRGRFPGEAAYLREMEANQVTDARITAAFERQAALLRFIDLRFRPEVQVQEADVVRYYENVFVPAAQKKGGAVPDLEEVRAGCEEAVEAQMVDQRVEDWLKDSRSRTRIRFSAGAFQ